MLATFVIGLREGLEAVLVVSIIAAFLRRQGISRRPMWLGVLAALGICSAVGIALMVFEQALPQAQQEALEAVIGLIAVVFVTVMIAWMGRNSRGLRAEIEDAASTAVTKGAGWALVAMAFLAVIKEGFETAVFLLATLQAATSVRAAAVGAIAGICAACGVGYGLYAGGIKLNLARFFRISSVFLVCVAAGLLLTAVRKAHGAGWVTFGQGRTLDLSWLAPVGSVRSALLTGVLGIPADPRMIEALAWLLFLVPMLTIALWPHRWKPRAEHRPVVKVAIAAGLGIAAIALAVLAPTGADSVPATVALSPAGAGTAAVSGGSPPELRVSGASAGTSGVAFAAGDQLAVEHAGVQTTQWSRRTAISSAARPSELTVQDLTSLFGRVPVGISPAQNPGPFQATWSGQTITTVWLASGGLMDATRSDQTILVLSGGGLSGSRTMTIDRTLWSTPAATVAARARTVLEGPGAAREARLWRVWLPALFLIAAAALCVSGWGDRRVLRRTLTAAAGVRPQHLGTT